MVFLTVEDPFIVSENQCGISSWGIATVAAAYSNEEVRVKASMDLAQQ